MIHRDSLKPLIAFAVHQAVGLVSGQGGAGLCMLYAGIGYYVLAVLKIGQFSIQAGNLWVGVPSHAEGVGMDCASPGSFERGAFHAWLAMPHSQDATRPGQVIDFSTRHSATLLVQQVPEVAALVRPDTFPPYLWHREQDPWPDWITLEPHLQTTRMVRDRITEHAEVYFRHGGRAAVSFLRRRGVQIPA